jgi:carbon monoxide dehydrogenase subunit G
VLKACIPGCEELKTGGAKVDLVEKEGGTLLSYQVEAQIGGKLAQSASG